MTQLEMLAKRLGDDSYALYMASINCPSDYGMRDIYPCKNNDFYNGDCDCIRCWLQKFEEVEE